MKVSIIIPVYNTEKYLRECIESALNQTYKDIEIIAVNDGSNDNSLKILESFKNRIKIISKKNGGTATALNEGIKNMTGEWFKWLSADDVLYSNAIEELMKEVESIFKVLESYDCGEILFADSAAQKEKLWKMRRCLGEAVKSKSIYKEEDTVVPRAELPELLNGVKAIGLKYGFRSVCYGHAGDGNLHVNRRLKIIAESVESLNC